MLLLLCIHLKHFFGLLRLCTFGRFRLSDFLLLFLLDILDFSHLRLVFLLLCLLLLFLLNLEELLIINLGILEELHGILVKLILPNFIPSLENLFVEHGFSSLAHEHVDEVIVAGGELLVDVCFHVQNRSKSNIKVRVGLSVL